MNGPEDPGAGRFTVLNHQGVPSGTRWLWVVNADDQPFSGVAVLSADFRTRAIAPVIVSDPQGSPVPSRRTNEVVGELEDDGKRRWAFDLEFFCDCPARGEVSYPATFGASAASEVSETAWLLRQQGGVLAAMELEWPHATCDDDRHRPAL